MSFTVGVMLAAAVGCGGDNSAVRAFHPSVKVGTHLSQVIIDGEKAQLADIEYSVSGADCPGESVEIRRRMTGLSVRVWDAQGEL